MSDRPNIVLVMADQLAASALPAYGNQVVHAPSLSALASSGTVFESAYCASPLCAPSRSALFSGQRPSVNGVHDNACELPASTPTIAHVLRAAGYRTALAGKMHFVGPDQLHGFEQRLTTDIYPADFDWTPDWRMSPAERLYWYHNMSSVLDPGPWDAAVQTAYDDEVCARSLQWLRERERTGDTAPFFLTVSFTNPHDPWQPRQEDWDLYAGAEIDTPAAPEVAGDPHSQRLRAMFLSDEAQVDAAAARTARRAYYACVSYIDRLVGELLAALGENTVVVFTADHGEMLGEHGLYYKMSFFEDSARVPLIVSGPGFAPGRVAEAVSLLDLAPTLAQLAGADASAAGFEGVSLTGPPPGRAVCEYLAEGVSAPAVMLRRGRFKFTHCGDDPEQLFDLEADPRELRNLAGEREHAATLAAFRAELDAGWDLTALDREVRAGQERRRLVGGALAKGAYTPWDFQPAVDASRQYVRGEAADRPRPSLPLTREHLAQPPE